MSSLPLEGRHVLLGVSGGIAAYKAASLARGLLKAGATVQAVLTAAAAEIVGPATFEGLTGRPVPAGVFTDAHRIVHVRLAREADVAVFAPATANVLAKLAHGLGDDLVSSTALCLTCPLVLAPAMHTEMWQHPATQANVAMLVARGAIVVGPDAGQLAGGDEGPGRLAEEPAILDAVLAAVGRVRDLAGLHVVVTAGGTREPMDPVRFIGNRSSGKMGYAVAAAAARRGAQVDLVAAPTFLADPAGVTVHHVETAIEMRDAVVPLAKAADVVVKAAAVADFRPAQRADQKIKKEDAALAVTLARNPDILAELGSMGLSAVLVGFAAETELEEEHGRAKLERKQIDLVVVNRVDAHDAGFAVDTNRALILGRDGSRREIPLGAKATLADIILDEVLAMRARGVVGGPGYNRR